MYTVVAVIATALVSSTVAIKPCDDSIVTKLKTVGDCYNGGTPPSTTLITARYDIIYVSEGDSPPCNECTMISNVDGKFQYTYIDDNQENSECQFTQAPNGDYIEETPVIGKCEHYREEAKLRIYPIHDESNVYSYYKCFTDGVDGQEGVDVGVLAKRRGIGEDSAANLVIEKAKKCFNALGIIVKSASVCSTDVDNQDSNNNPESDSKTEGGFKQ